MPSSLFNRLLGLILIVVVLGACGRTVWIWLDQPIQSVHVDGHFEHIRPNQLSHQLSQLVTGQRWLSIDLDTIRNEVLQIPWIAQARVTRQWPNTLDFQLQEQQPVAWWNDNGLLNADGQPFVASSANSQHMANMPHLAGPDDRSADVLALYAQLKQRLSPLGLTVTQVRLEARGAWRFQVNNEFWVVLGRGDLTIRVTRFIVAWQRALSSEVANINYIDLRYPNGLAVGWKGKSSGKE
ncbi:Cell division protein FtsQ [Halomonadaceae bacterium LMG 33818]|uniref:cell division protein FtsQ/DivIB n=1 Tax=Cernens ardua TaxID=3402176 RepID=UPI003EDBF8EA